MTKHITCVGCDQGYDMHSDGVHHVTTRGRMFECKKSPQYSPYKQDAIKEIVDAGIELHNTLDRVNETTQIERDWSLENWRKALSRYERKDYRASEFDVKD